LKKSKGDFQNKKLGTIDKIVSNLFET